LTVDNGSEFERFKELENQTGLAVYFADPMLLGSEERMRIRMVFSVSIFRRKQILAG
jgi:IS30 family transposase